MHRIALPPCELTLELLHIQRYPLQAHCAPHHGWPFGSCKRGSSGRVALLPALITIKHIKGDIEHLQQKVNDKKKSFEKLQWCLDKQNESQCAGHQQCGAPARPSQRCSFKTGVATTCWSCLRQPCSATPLCSQPQPPISLTLLFV